MDNKGKRGRDAGIGKFVTVREAEQRRNGAIVETFKKDSRGRPVN